MVYMNANRSNAHVDPLLGSRWTQMWAHMWVHTLVIYTVYVTKGNTHPKVYANTKPKSLHNNNGKDEVQMVTK